MINRFLSSSVYFGFVISIILSTSSDAKIASKCRDTDMNCAVWVCYDVIVSRSKKKFQVATNSSDCENVELVSSHCQRSCQVCGEPIDPSKNGVKLTTFYGAYIP